MKKVLFASTALVAAGLFSGAASASEPVKLQLGGFSKWWVVGAWQDSAYEKAALKGGSSLVNADIKGDNEVYFKGSTTLDNGITVGVEIQLEAGGGDTTDQIDESFVTIGGGFGTLMVGSHKNGLYLLGLTAPDAAGNWNDGGIMTGASAIAKPANVQVPGLLANKSSLSTLPATSDKTEKLTYVAPAFYGLTVGGSYVPDALAGDEDNRGVATAEEMYGVAALYATTVGGVGVKVNAGYAWADLTTTTNTSFEWNAGTQLSYAGFTLGGSYRQVGENANNSSNSTALTASSDGNVWDIGLSYASGPYAVSIAYIRSKVEGDISTKNDDTVTAYQASGKYNLGAGVDVLASVGHIEYKDEGSVATDSNKGWTAMTGLSLTF